MIRFALSILLLATGCAALQRGAEEAASGGETVVTDRAVPVKVSPAVRADLVRTLRLAGVARAWQNASLAPQAQGTVEAIHVGIGSVVQRGQVLAEIDTTTLGLQAEQGRRAVELARLQAEDATREYGRARGLAETGALPPATLDKAAFGEKLAQAQLAQAEAAVRVIEAQLGHATLRAPFAGTVTAVAADVGEFWAPVAGLGGGPVLVQLDDLQLIRLDVHLADVDLARVTAGLAATVTTDALPGQVFAGKVELINASAETGARTFLAVLSVPNPESVLKPGMFLTAAIAVDSRAAVLAVPPEAVTVAGAETWVAVVESGKAKRHPVQTGLRGDSGWEVQGVPDGAQVIVEGHFGLPDGSDVRVVQ